jgi:hypothetical protein
MDWFFVQFKFIVMKTLLFTFFGMSLLNFTFAQIPNAGFESWTSTGPYENPDSWTTLNSNTAPLGVFTAEKGTPGSPGSSYLKLTSKTVGTAVVNGMATCGQINLTTGQMTPGFACTAQPVSFTGKWQHMIYGSSQGSLSAILTRWDPTTNTRITVAVANKVLTGMAMSWANFTIPFVYTDFNAPDSCFIILNASGNTPTDQDYLWVDNLAFTGSVAGLSTLTNDGPSIYPNPSSDYVKISRDVNTDGVYQIQLVNIQGTVVKQLKGQTSNGKMNEQLDLKMLPKGTYILQLEQGEERISHPIIIQ